MAETDFLQEALHWQPLKTAMKQGFNALSTLVFCADFIMEPNRDKFSTL
jgi:hypothetical protein